MMEAECMAYNHFFLRFIFAFFFKIIYTLLNMITAIFGFL